MSPQNLKKSATTKAARPGRSRSARPGQVIQEPLLDISQYNKVSSFLISVLLGLGFALLMLVLIWAFLYQSPPSRNDVPITMVNPGGDEDGNLDETFELESLEEPIPDPVLAKEFSEEVMTEETVDAIVELAENATQQLQEFSETSALNAGSTGSAVGTGRPLGSGPGTGSGFPREQRWFIAFGEDTLSIYAAQLDFFEIEVGGLFQEEGRLVYLSNLSQKKPSIREVTTGKGEERLYMSWTGSAERKNADLELFKKAGIDANDALILHFYSPETEQLLARLEKEYRSRDVKEVRRTYFSVRNKGSGYEFFVTKQQYF